MTARRKFDPAIAARVLAICEELGALSDQLAEATAKELAACCSPKEAEAVLERFVSKLIDRLDEEAAKVGLPANYYQPKILH